MMTHVWTIQMSQWRKAAALNVQFIDTTAKSGNPLFAPDFANVMAYKAGQLSEGDYTERYYAKMRESYRNHKTQWTDLLKHDKVAYACYCPKGVFCHRHLFVDMLEKIAKAENVTLVRMGELV